MNRIIVSIFVVAALFVACGGGEEPAEEEQGQVAGAEVDVPLPDWVEQKGQLAVGVKCDYPPFGFIDDEGNNAGFDVALARHLAQVAFGDSDAIQFQCVTSENRIPQLLGRRVDLLVATLTYTPERAETITYSRPYFTAAGKLLVPQDSDVENVADLEGRTLITTRGVLYLDWVAKCVDDVDTLLFDTVSKALQALKQGRGDAFLQDDTLLTELASNNPDLRMTGDGVASIPWGVGTRPDDDDLAEWVNAVLEQMKEDDVFWDLFQEWIDPELTEQFADSMPRPESDLTYPETEEEVFACEPLLGPGEETSD